MSTATLDSPIYLTYRDVERSYGLPRHAVLRMAKNHRLTIYRPGGRKALIRREELERAIAASAEPATNH